MPGVQLAFTDEDKQRITDRMRELARFEEGDRVTVEPSDTDIAYAGRELEGVPLTVSDVFWNSSNLGWVLADDHPKPRRYEASRRDRYGDEGYERRAVELQGEYEHTVNYTVFIESIDYSFRDVNGEHVHHMGERALIPWAEYREDHDRVHLKPSRDGKYAYVEPMGAGASPCPVCGCEMRNVSGHDQQVVHVGSEDCAACGYNFGYWD